MKKVSVLLADGFEEIEALTVVDLLRRAKIYVDTVSAGEDYMVRGSHGINVQTEDLFEEVNFADFNMIVLPGGPGVSNLEEHNGIRRLIKDFAETGRYIAAICAAPSILANMGLLKGKRVTCYPTYETKLPGAVISPVPVMEDGNIITGRSAGTAVDFALKLIEVLMGKDKAKEIASAIVYEQLGKVTQ